MPFITAKFGGKCVACGGSVELGDRIYWDAARPKQAYHAGCAPVSVTTNQKTSNRTILLSPGGTRLVAKFDYEPQVIEAIKRIDGARWEGKTKEWFLPITVISAPQIVRFVENFGFVIAPNVRQKLQQEIARGADNLENSRSLGMDLEVHDFGTDILRPRPYQKAGIAYGIKNERIIIADEPGVGKTVQAMGLIHILDALPALIVCPAVVVRQWRRELLKWMPYLSDQDILILKGRKAEEIPADYSVVLLNWDILHAWQNVLRKHNFQIAIFDEFHYAKSHNSQRAVAAYNIAQKIRFRIGLTGTPVLNRPSELIQPLKILGRLNEFGGFWRFSERYCNPPEAPIWMGDFKFKPLGEVREGDEVIGWEKKDSGNRWLVRAQVMGVHRHAAPITKVTLASGEVVRCTPDHKWLISNNSEKDQYRFNIAKKGRKLSRIVNVPPSLPEEKIPTANYLAGIYDGEGTRTRLAQSKAANPVVYGAIREALKELEFPFAELIDGSGLELTGGRKQAVRWANWIPTRKNGRYLDQRILQAKFKTPDEIVSIEPDGEGEVIGLTTTTGNYVAWGLGSHNCGGFQDRFGYNISGATNLKELNDRLRQTCLVRRRKVDVLTDLPPKTRDAVPVVLTTQQRNEYDRAEYDLAKWLGERAAEDKRFLASIAHLPRDQQIVLKRQRAASKEMAARGRERLLRFTALKKLSAELKLDTDIEWIKNFLETGEKLIVFAYFHDIQNRLRESFPEAVTIFSRAQGGTDTRRDQAQQRFQNDPDCKLALCSLGAAREGIDLYAASTVFFVDYEWTPAKHDQAEDRSHRSGQLDPVTAWYAVAEDTIDEELLAIIDGKRKVVTEVADGSTISEDATINALITHLLSKYKLDKAA